MNSPLLSAPETVLIEELPVTPFWDYPSFFGRIRSEIEKPAQAQIFYVNVHAANLAHQDPAWRETLQAGDLLYCDGAGIVLAGKLLGTPIPMRLTAADWLPDFLRFMADAKLTVFFLGGEPGVPEKAMQYWNTHLPNHTVIGAHHGYIHDNPALEQAVIDQINALQPDLLFVGFGMPLQEFWMARNRHRLNVRALWALGAALDYFTGKVPRCPAWMGKLGLEWLFRLWVEPGRMFNRYVVGNPWFLSRILWRRFRQGLLGGPHP